jgi:hypothetical protein
MDLLAVDDRPDVRARRGFLLAAGRAGARHDGCKNYD